MKDLKVLDFYPYYSHPPQHNAMMMDHLLRVSENLRRTRRKPRNLEEWLEQRDEIRNRLMTSLGIHDLEKTPLNQRLAGRIEKEKYFVEKIIFESRPDFYVAANLYRPKNAAFPAPAVLCPHGHWPYGKQDAVVQARCIGLTLRGYIVLALDEVGYGDRIATGHHDSLYLPMANYSLAGLQVWDNMRAIDLLCSRDDVDKERIGCTGCSGGGDQTMYVTAVDERIKVAVPVVSVCTFEGSFSTCGGLCPCDCIPNVMRYADEAEICSLIAPRPLLAIAGTKDEIFPISETRSALLDIRDAYRLFGAEERLKLAEFYADHGYSKEMREAMYEWFDRWLMNKEDVKVAEPKIWPEANDTLSCFGIEGYPSKGETIPSLYAKVSAELPRRAVVKTAMEWKREKQRLQEAIIMDVFGGFPIKEPLTARLVERMDCEDYVVEKIMYRSEPDIIIPSLMFLPREAASPSPAVVCVTPKGKDVAFDRKSVQRIVSEGHAVFAIDYRGIGETGDRTRHRWFPLNIEAGDHLDDYYELENVLARISLVLGRHIFGMRVYDVIRAIDYLETRRDIDKTRLTCWGEFSGGLLALYAGALDERVRTVISNKTLVSYKSDKGFTWPPSVFLPGILRYADIQDIASMVAPRRLLVTNPVDSHMKRAGSSDEREKFMRTKEIYALLHEERSFELFTGSSLETQDKLIGWLKST